MNRKNPFVIEGYAGPEYFCDREEETRKLLSALQNGRNVTLYSIRRMGKTGLIKRAFEEARQQGVYCFYVDLLSSHCLNDLVSRLATEVLGALDGPIASALAKVSRVFGRLRPMVKFDEMTGAPQLSVDVERGTEGHTLEQVFTYIEQSGKSCYIALDEFQQITEYPEKGALALLRSHIQFMNNTNFVYAGSRKHLMMEIFNSPSSPFYMSSQTLSLGPVAQEAYYQWAARFFEQSHRILPRESFDYIYGTVMAHTYYIQRWLNALYENAENTISPHDAKATLLDMLHDDDEYYFQLSNILNDKQLDVATAIAHEKEVKQPYATAFRSRYHLPPATTLRNVIQHLLKLNVLVEERGVLSVYNRFFALWLRRRYAAARR